jgi:hypothetical protein
MDGGAETWAVIASLIQTAKLNEIEPLACCGTELSAALGVSPCGARDALPTGRVDFGVPDARI